MHIFVYTANLHDIYANLCVVWSEPISTLAQLSALNFFKSYGKLWKVVEFLCSNRYNLCDRECNSDLLALNLTQLGG